MKPLSQLTIAIKDKIRVCDVEMFGAELSEAELSKLQADRLDLRSANMTGAKLRAVRFRQCKLEGARFENADFTNAVLRMFVLDGGQGTSACFNNARIEDSTAKGASFRAAEMKGAKLSETSFERAVLQEAFLDGAEGEGTVFRGADLSGASLVGAHFGDADFRGADLRGADLSNGRFPFADFRGALLEGTIFEGTDFNGAIFDANEGPNAITDEDKSAEQGKSESDKEFAKVLTNLLGDSLKNLPNELADNKELNKVMTDGLKQAGNTFKATAKHSPEEWKEWAESFLALAKNKETVNLETIVEALYEGPIKFQDQSVFSEVPKDEMLDRMRTLIQMLNSTASEPPDEWKPFFELFIKKS
jgi:uncharacterized protein YjbI with pentapeptide repeats